LDALLGAVMDGDSGFPLSKSASTMAYQASTSSLFDDRYAAGSGGSTSLNIKNSMMSVNNATINQRIWIKSQNLSLPLLGE
jgi:hypothetical protein